MTKRLLMTTKKRKSSPSTPKVKPKILKKEKENLFGNSLSAAAVECPVCQKKVKGSIAFEAHLHKCLNNPKPFTPGHSNQSIDSNPGQWQADAKSASSDLTIDSIVELVNTTFHATVNTTIADTAVHTTIADTTVHAIVDIAVNTPVDSAENASDRSMTIRNADDDGKIQMNGDEKDESKIVKEEKVKRPCPWYKHLSGTTFTVDAFNYGAVPGCTAYFLSHFHSDHYMGLGKNWSHGPIYCSEITARLLKQELRVADEWIHPLPMRENTIQNVKVFLIDANHCPGAVLFLFDIPQTKKRILHTGDFRASETHWTLPKLLERPIDIVYLDTTYCKPIHTFPDQKLILDLVAGIVAKAQQGTAIKSIFSGFPSIKSFFSAINPIPPKPVKTLYVFGSYSIGKERVFLRIAQEINSKIFTVARKSKIYEAQETPEISNRLTKDPLEAQVHVVTMGALKEATLNDMLQEYKIFDQIVAFRPTGWTFSPPNSSSTDAQTFKQSMLKPVFINSKITVIPVPYSEHSSYTELKMFCRKLEIQRIIPTVNLSPQSIKEMEHLFKSWKAKC